MFQIGVGVPQSPQVSVPELVSLVDAFARKQDGHRAKAWQERIFVMECNTVKPVVSEGASLMAWAHLGDLRKAALSTSRSSDFGEIQWLAMLDACAKSSSESMLDNGSDRFKSGRFKSWPGVCRFPTHLLVCCISLRQPAHPHHTLCLLVMYATTPGRE